MASAAVAPELGGQVGAVGKFSSEANDSAKDFDHDVSLNPNSFVRPEDKEEEWVVVDRKRSRRRQFQHDQVGSIVGAVTGGLIGLATESGLLRGAGIGAISGVVFGIEAFESSLSIWRSNESGIWSVLYVIDIVCSLLSGRLVREKVGPAMHIAVQSQMSAVDSPFVEAIDIFDAGGIKGLTKESVERLPMISITTQNNVNDMGERICCAVCLQDFEIGERVRCLPHCWHKFHLPCIDGWLIRHGSCPLCRRDF